jgi:salicylate hydroxylase
MMPHSEVDADLEIAVIGGGIVGLIMGMGLAKRGIKVGVFEQASGIREIGAGVAFTTNAIRCMGMIDSKIVDAVRAVATSNGDPGRPTDYLQWVDGFHHDNGREGSDGKLLFKLDCGYRGFEGCHRAHLLDEILARIDPSLVHFGKRLISLFDSKSESKVRLQFQDGKQVYARAVIGCDGIKSQVRKVLIGEDNPQAHPHFSHKVAFRALVPMEKAEAAIGPYKARHQHMHTGPGAHLLHFPVADQTLINIVAFVDEPNDWTRHGEVDPEGDRYNSKNNSMVAPATRDEVAAAFSAWGPTVRKIISLLPQELDKWAIFDTYDHPLPTYTMGRVCLAGDAAHASSPHHGAGAGIGVEDALALCTLLERVFRRDQTEQFSGFGVERAFIIYDTLRRERSQWLVASSREVCDMYEWRHPDTGTDMEKCLAEITERSHKLWYFDIDGMLNDLNRSCLRELQAQ